MEKKIRPPIIVVLGHVDHGKTSLLDYIRETRIAQKEAGGITQRIGASQVTTKSGKKITFIDTPGHAAFSQMRSRGAEVADIAVLIVAGDAGVQPQTKEAIEHIRNSSIPFIVAVTKVDLNTVSVESALDGLEKEGVLLEKRGGNVPWVKVSSKTGEGVEELLETISLLADLNEIQGEPSEELEAVVIETFKSKSGPLVNVVVRNGTLKAKDLVYSEFGCTKIKNLFNEKGILKEANPGDPAQILGFDKLPLVGTKIVSTVFDMNEKEKKKAREKLKEGQIGVLIKADNSGCLEAILSNLPDGIAVIESGFGDVCESDILFAKSSGISDIYIFNLKVSPHILKLAEAEGVVIHSFEVIYELFQELEDLIDKNKVKILGEAEVVASFPFDKKKVAGCKMLRGSITKDSKLIFQREGKDLSQVKAISLKKQKQEVSEVKQGEEFGILFEPQLDFKRGDMLVSVA